MKTEDKPRFLLAAEELARQRGTDAQEILRRNREAVRNSGYPGPDCLVPEEIESFFADPDGLEADRAKHAENCAGCSALLASAGVDPGERERFLTQVRAQSRVFPRPVLVREETGRSEGAKNYLSTSLKWTLTTLGSILAFAFGSLLLRLSKRRSSQVAHTAPGPEEAMAAPIAAKKM